MLAFEESTDFIVTIENSRIIENTAISSGGGVFVSFYDNSTNNKVVIKNTSFERNVCDQNGGAISVNTFEVANDNVLVIEDSTFSGNKAKFGGGAFSLNLQVHTLYSTLNKLQLNFFCVGILCIGATNFHSIKCL